jgi:hypothetical protein
MGHWDAFEETVVLVQMEQKGRISPDLVRTGVISDLIAVTGGLITDEGHQNPALSRNHSRMT